MALATVQEVAHGMDEQSTRRRMEEIYESIGETVLRVELLEGRVVVSPPPVGLHTLIVFG